jgi:uncharacterized protein YcbK (DUF882 family)
VIHTFAKNSNKSLSANFKANEFDCKCTRRECIFTLIDPQLITLLQALRDFVKVPIFIKSAYRCTAHQKKLRQELKENTASSVSTHELGQAVDIFTNQHTGEELAKAARVLGFKAVGVGERFIHVDLRDDKIRSWTYPY